MVYIFAYQKSQFGYFLAVLVFENVCIFYSYFGRLGMFLAIWYIIWPFGIFWNIFSCFGDLPLFVDQLTFLHDKYLISLKSITSKK
jgi:lantibiotic modifying enzyme